MAANDNCTTYQSLTEVPTATLVAFAAVLTMPPNQLDPKTGSPSEEWLASQKTKLPELPKGLLRRSGLRGFSQKLADRFRPSPAFLCDTHKGLNPRLTGRAFWHLCDEVTRHADRVRAHAGPHAAEPAVRAWGDRMLGVAALWSDPSLFRLIAGRAHPRPARLPHLDVPCEACALAAVGARGQLLADLRASLLSRARFEAYESERAARRRGSTSARKAGRPALWRVVEAWVDLFGADRADALRAQSEALADALFRVRKYEARLRRETRRRYRAELAASEGAGLTMAQYREAKGRDPCADTTPRIHTKAGHAMPRPRPVAAEVPVESDGEVEETASRRSTSTVAEPARRERYVHLDGHYPSSSAATLRMSGAQGPMSPSAVEPSAAEQQRVDFDFQDDDDDDDDVGGDEDVYEDEYPSRDEDMLRWLDGTADASKSFVRDSCVPAPLAVKKTTDGGATTTTAADPDDDGSWVSATVHTFGDGDTNAPPPPPVPRIPTPWANEGDAATPPPPSSVYSSDQPAAPASEASGAPYVPARAGWKAATAGAAPSSYGRLQRATAARFAAGPRSAVVTEANDGSIGPDDSISVVALRRAEGQAKFARVPAVVVGAAGPPPVVGGNTGARGSRSTRWGDLYRQ